MEGCQAEHDVHLLVGGGGVEFEQDDAAHDDGREPADVPMEAGQEHAGPADGGVGQDEEGERESARAAVAQAHGEGSLACGGVLHAVAYVVDLDEQAGEDAALHADDEGAAVHRRPFRNPADLHEDGSRHGHQPEEQQHAELAQPVVGERVRPARVAIRCRHARQADGDDGRALLVDERDGERRRRRQEARADEQHRARREIPAGGDAARALPPLGVGVLEGVDGVVEDVAGNLEAHAAQRGEGGERPVERDAQRRHVVLELPDDEAAGPHRHQPCGQGFGARGQDDGCQLVHGRKGKITCGGTCGARRWPRGKARTNCPARCS